MSKTLIKHLEKQFNISITQQSYIEEKNVHLFTDGFLFIIASESLDHEVLKKYFISFKTMKALAWEVAQNVEEILQKDTKAEKVFNDVIARFKGATNKPILEQEATGKFEAFSWLAYTDSSGL